jgi:hypothetical protein
MVTFRPTKMLATRMGVALAEENVPTESLHTDWCAHTFTAQRYRYIILTNTHSFLSMVMSGSGISSGHAFTRAAFAAIRDYLVGSGRSVVFEQSIRPAMTEARFARIPDRRIMGTINELVFQATLELVEGRLSPIDASERLNDIPLSALWNRGDTIAPGPTFDRMPARL